MALADSGRAIGAVTRLLQAMGLLIAVCGVTVSLLVVARERVRELALYRALGATRAAIFRVFLGHGLGIASVGLALGALSIVLAGLAMVAWMRMRISIVAPT